VDLICTDRLGIGPLLLNLLAKLSAVLNYNRRVFSNLTAIGVIIQQAKQKINTTGMLVF